jgi:hypothetical protein
MSSGIQTKRFGRQDPKWASALNRIWGDPLELDDYVVEECLRKRGVIGTVHPSVVPEIYAAVRASKTISVADKELIRVALGVASDPPADLEGRPSK